jgi:hypothetical protein
LGDMFNWVYMEQQFVEQQFVDFTPGSDISF